MSRARRRVQVYGHDGEECWEAERFRMRELLERVTEPMPEDLAVWVVLESCMESGAMECEVVVVELGDEDH